MGLFSSFFRRSKTPAEHVRKSDLEMLMVDWFSDAGLSYDHYKTEFYPKVFEIYSQNKYVIKNLESNENEKNNLDLSIAFTYLIYHYPELSLLERLYDIIDEHLKKGLRYYFHYSFNANDCKDIYPEFANINEVVKVIWQVIQKKQIGKNFFEGLNFSHMKYSFPQGYIKLMKFMANLESEFKLPFLLNFYTYKALDYKTKKYKDYPDNIQEEVKKILTKEIDSFNKSQTYIDFDLDFFQQLFDIVYNKEGFDKWHHTDYKDRAKIKLEEYQNFVDFINKHDTKKIIKHFLFIYYFHFNLDFYQEMFMYFKEQGLSVLDKSFLQDLITIIANNPVERSIGIEELIIPFANNLYIHYDDSLREQLEQLVIYDYTKQQILDTFIKIAGTIDGELKRRVVTNKYHRNFGYYNHTYHSSYFLPGPNGYFARKSFNLIAKFIDLSIIGVKDEDGPEGYATYLHIIYKGQKRKVIYEEINTILYNEKTGYQLVPIPIKLRKNSGYDSGTAYICGLGFLNKQEFDYLVSEYMPEYFPQIEQNFYNIVSRKYLYNHYNPLTFNDFIAQNTKPKSSNKFLSEYNWRWFKDTYIDQLPNAKAWYDLMNVIISYTGSKKPSKKWKEKMKEAISKHGEDLYYKELRTLINASLDDDFWYSESNRKALKGIVWSCTLSNQENSLMILKEIIAQSYRKIPGVGPRSIAIGNAGLDALISHPNQDSFGILNLLKNQTKYTRFAKVLDKYIDKYIQNSDEDEEVLADKAIPDFGFVNGEKVVKYKDFSIKYIIKNKKLTKKWIVNDKETSTTPAFVKEQYPKLVKEVAIEYKFTNAFLKTVKTRVKTYWLHNRKWTFKEWNKNIRQKELLNPWLQGLVWKNETTNTSFILLDNQILDSHNKPVSIAEKDIISLWHPVTATHDEIVHWQKFIVQHKVEQSERQVFREHYPFSDSELELTDTPRFNHHFLQVNKLMAIANAAGWVFTYVHDDVNWPRTYIKSLNITAHLTCDYIPYDVAIPTKGFFITKDDTRKITYNQKFEKVPFKQIPIITLSELCRDVDLFIATTSVAHDIELSKQSEMLQHYRDNYSNMFSDNAQAQVRKDVIKLIGDKIGLKQFDFEKNYLIIKGTLNDYSINLGSGFAQIRDTKKHLPIIPDIKQIKKKTRQIIPVKDDETLYIILAKALFLQSDNSITDQKILDLLK